MLETQEPKYGINENGQLFNRKTGNVIPDDEPVFILRARDIHAADTLRNYYAACEIEGHRKVVYERIVDFNRFAIEHPDRMREPGELRQQASEAKPKS